MNSTIKGLLFIVLGVVFLAWFGYEALGFLSRGGYPAEENAVFSMILTLLKLVASVSFFVSALNSFRQKD